VIVDGSDMTFFRELMEKDDEEALKFHQGVVQGELRRKRKNRFGIDESDEEDEEDERARRIRRKMRQRTERGDIKELGGCLFFISLHN
jgi:mediator of replication checkpoint protein 1